MAASVPGRRDGHLDDAPGDGRAAGEPLRGSMRILLALAFG